MERVFVQDDWQLRNNLTVTLGLRWSYFGSISENSGDLSSVVLGQGNAALTGLSLRLGGHLYDVDKSNFGPQTSIAWSPSRFNGRLVVRGGAGIAYNGLDQAISLNGRGNAPFLSTAGNLTDGQIVYGVNSFPANVNSFSGYGSNPGHHRHVRSEHESAGARRAELRADLAHRLSREMAVDAVHSVLGRSRVRPRAPVGRVAGISGQHDAPPHDSAQSESSCSRRKGVPLNPVVDYLEYYSNDGKALFNAMLAGIRHRFANSFELAGQYRLSRSMDDGSNNFAE